MIQDFKTKPSSSTAIICIFACVFYLTCVNVVDALSGCFKLNFLLRRARSTCVVAYVTDGCQISEQTIGYITFQNLRNLSLNHEIGVLVGFVDIKDSWPDKTKLTAGNGTVQIGDVLLFEKVQKDYIDLEATIPESLDPDVLGNTQTLEDLIELVNRGCNTYFTATGSLSRQGLHREEILRSKFHVKNISNVQSKDVFLQKCFQDNQFCYADGKSKTRDNIPKLPECEKIDLPSKTDFFNNYLTKSKPVIFKNVLQNWPAFTKWSNKYLREKYGQKIVKFQLTPHGEFERIEHRNEWGNQNQIKLSKFLTDKMPFPDLVMARPAAKVGNFSFFLDILEGVSNGSISNLSVYFEYASIPEFLPELEEDIREDTLLGDISKREQLNIWLGDGRTVGKMHFDGSDNFLCQMRGKKQVILIDPHSNHQLYEGHIQEATMSYNFSSNSFERQHLLDELVYVWTPFDISNPDYSRFPLFGETYPMNCTVEEGEVLFIPSFWWHEVKSFPNVTEGRNLAINFWYEPFFERNYPCPECQLDINPTYRDML